MSKAVSVTVPDELAERMAEWKSEFKLLEGIPGGSLCRYRRERKHLKNG